MKWLDQSFERNVVKDVGFVFLFAPRKSWNFRQNLTKRAIIQLCALMKANALAVLCVPELAQTWS